MSYNVYVNSPSPRATGHNARIGELLVRTAETPDRQLTIRTVSTQAPRSDDSASIYEEVDDIGFTFARYNHTGGEGLAWFPPRSNKVLPELDPIRYYDSYGIRVGREDEEDPYRLELAKAFEVHASDVAYNALFAHSTGIYAGWGSSIEVFDDWDDTTKTSDAAVLSTTKRIFGSYTDDIVALTQDGDLYMKPKGATAWALAYEAGVDGAAVTGAWWAKGRIIASRVKATTLETAELVEIATAVSGTAGAPTITPTVTPIDSFGADVRYVVDASIAIVAALTNGELRSYVPQVDTAGDVPILTLRGTTPMPSNEVPYLLGYSTGKLVILTYVKEGAAAWRLRAYSAEVLDERFDFVIGQLQTLNEWYTDRDPFFYSNAMDSDMVTTRNAIWWLITTDDDEELWYYDVITTGVFREWAIEGSAVNGSLIIRDNRMGYLHNTHIYRRATTYLPEGYLITPNITFGRNDDIAWMNAKVIAENLGASLGTVTISYSGDPAAIYDSAHASWQQIAGLSDESQSGVDLSMGDYSSKQIALKIEIRSPTSRASTPRVLRYSIRGIPAAREWVVPIPVNVSDRIEVPFRQPYDLPGWGEAVMAELYQLKGRNIEVEIISPHAKFQGIVDSVGVPVQYIPDRGSPTIYAVVEIRGKQLSGSEQFTGINAWALVPWASGIWATGEGEVDLV